MVLSEEFTLLTRYELPAPQLLLIVQLSSRALHSTSLLSLVPPFFFLIMRSVGLSFTILSSE